jgi:predicted metal-dependent HD superfamily phosphohydrolase
MPRESEMTIARWLRLMNAWSFGENRATCEALVAAYSERGRHYHTVEHVSACLRHLDGFASELDSPREVEIALWFHDAIYKALSSHNEKDSADWAVSFMTECGSPPEEIGRVRRLIMATAHIAPTQTRDEAALVDIDLSILGAEPSIYEAFERGVRKEYRLVPWFIYRKKRAEVLRGFSERPKIYTSGIFSEAIERQAKANLSNAVSELVGRA